MREDKAGHRLSTFKFLGFTCYWGKSRRGFWTLRFVSRRDRFASTLKRLKDFLRKSLSTADTPSVILTIMRMVRGWVNYHHISYNWRRVNSFIELSKRLLLRWFNRRGGKKRLTWQKFMQILKFYGFPRKEDF